MTMPSPRTLTPLPYAMVAGLLLLFLYVWPLLLSAPLTDPDEGLHAAIAQTMVERGDLVVPHFLDQPFLDKPILYFWAQAASLNSFGMNPAAVRLPGLLFAVLGVMTTGWLASALFGASVGWLSAICYATLAVPFALAQAPVHDIALVPFVNLALLAFWRYGERDASPLHVVAAGVVLGLSVLTKGLAGIAVVGVAFGLMLVISRRVTVRLIVGGLAALVIAGLVAAPWYMAMETREPGYLQYYFVSRHLMGFATTTQPHGNQPWWYYLPILIGGGLPWVLYVSRDPISSAPIRRDTASLTWCWMIGGLVVLSVAGSKLVTYALPLFPPMAMLAARAWSRALDQAESDRRVLTRARVHTLIFAALAAALPWAIRADGVDVGLPASIVFGIASLAWLYVWQSIPTQSLGWTWRRLALGTGATYALTLVMLAPAEAQAHSALELATQLNRSPRLPDTVFVVGERIGSVVFYLRPELRQSLEASRFQTVGAEEAVTRATADDLIVVPKKVLSRAGNPFAVWSGPRMSAGRFELFVPPRPLPVVARREQ